MKKKQNTNQIKKKKIEYKKKEKTNKGSNKKKSTGSIVKFIKASYYKQKIYFYCQK